ncbi:MAG: FAD-dependent oxidoreductase [Solirubrobacteraceae bacterium]|nr:FAD-dependent oxidoreductase [Solirubrobacteraceae bacterium]
MSETQKTPFGASLSRRRFLQRSAAAAVAGSALAAAPAARAAAGPGRRVAILGGGVAGLSAALELIERGFDVTVYEPRELGGKARSNVVPGSGTGGRPDLPGEHGYRGFLGYYHNLHELMARIPVPEDDRGTLGRLTASTTAMFSREGRADMTISGFGLPVPNRFTPAELGATLTSGLKTLSTLRADEAAVFVGKLLTFMTSSEERRYGQWEHMTWNRFLKSDRHSQEYDRLFGHGLTRNLSAMRSDEASANSIGIIGEATVYGVLDRGLDAGAAPVDVLRGATNEMWIHPWVDHLRALGVQFEVGPAVTELRTTGNRISGAVVRDAAGISKEVVADWYVLAVPTERAAPLMSPALVAIDPRLGQIKNLRTDWMNGLQFYLRSPLPITHGGVSYVDSPWALTSINQAQFWQRDLREYGDGTVREIVSTAIADWETPGVVYGKTAKQCTREEIAREVWVQMQRHLNDGFRAEQLRDDQLHSWWLDPAITNTGTSAAANDSPLFIQTPGSWEHRPEASGAVENLFLASDYVRHDIHVTTMEGANIAARKAVNALLDRAGSVEPKTPVRKIYSAPEFAGFKQLDRARYRLGLPNMFDVMDPSRP